MTVPGVAGDDGPLGVVLAAGRGARFGGTKQLALLDGRPLVLHAVRAVAEAGLPVLVVVGHDRGAVAAVLSDNEAGMPVRVVANPDHRRGQGSSLATAARWAGRRDLVVVLGDQPGIRTDAVTRVLAALRDGATAARIVHEDGPGHPVALAAALHDRLVDLRTDGAGRALLSTVDVVAVAAEGPRPVDVDTPEDLARLAAGGGGPDRP